MSTTLSLNGRLDRDCRINPERVRDRRTGRLSGERLVGVRRGDIVFGMRMMPIGLAAAVALLLSGCASLGPAEEADARKLTWFSYVNGEDLRAQCSSGGA